MEDDKTLMAQIDRMNQRIDEAAKAWNEERQKITTELEEFRGKLSEALGKLLAAETTKARQAVTIVHLRECLVWLNQPGNVLSEEQRFRIERALHQ